MPLLRASFLTTLVALVTLLGAGRAAAQPPCPSGPPCDNPEEDRRAREDRRESYLRGRGPETSTGRILGVVLDEDGRPLRGASIVVTNHDAVMASITVQSDKKGRFDVVSARGGTWTVVAQKPGYASASSVLQVRQGSDVPPVKLTLRTVSAMTSALGAVTPVDLQGALATANELYDRQRWDEAIAAYRSILVLAPALSTINLQIAAIYRRKGDYDAAIESYNEMLKTDPNNSRAKVGIAIANVERGDITAAERTLEAASRADGATSEVFLRLAEVKMSRGLTDEASQAYKRAAQLDPASGKPVFALAQIALGKGDRSAATQYFRMVVAIDPSSPEAERARTALEGLER